MYSSGIYMDPQPVWLGIKLMVVYMVSPVFQKNRSLATQLWKSIGCYFSNFLQSYNTSNRLEYGGL